MILVYAVTLKLVNIHVLNFPPFHLQILANILLLLTLCINEVYALTQLTSDEPILCRINGLSILVGISPK